MTTSAKNIYVAKNGNDSNAGTEASPYLTISKAATVAVAGDVVYIKQGTYEETLTPTNSGTAGNPIVFQSYPGDKVIISAMEALSGWTLDSGNVYKTTIPFASLGQDNFVMNGATACDLARWPNKTDKNPFALNTLRNTGGSGSDVATGAYLLSNQIPAIDWTGGTLYFYGDKAGSGWLAWKETITSSSSGRVNFELNKNPTWIRTAHAPADLGDFYLEGVKGALDYQNEWYFNETTKELFLQFPAGVVPTDGVVKMKRRNLTVNLNGKKYIEIKNLAVFGGRIEIKGTTTTNNTLYRVTALYCNHTLGVFSGFSANKPAVFIEGTNNLVDKCDIGFGAASGIQIAGTYNKVTNTRIHDFNYLGSYDAPLMARGGNYNTFKNNSIFNGGRDAIQYFGQYCEFAYNDVSKSNLIADDCGLFYTVGKQLGTEIHHNWFHDAASTGTKYKAAGIYLDNDAESFSVHHNVVWNTEWSSIQINWNGKDINIFNNTLWNGSTVMGAWHKEGTAFSNVNVWNNLGSSDTWEPQSDKQNNLVVTTTVFENSTLGDFRLKANASPIDKGKIIPGITDGYAGASPDAGAYEFGDNWVAGINWNPKYGPTGMGCYGVPGEDCINDADNDGIEDALDLCPNTPVGTKVNSAGCAYFVLPNDNFKIQTIGESCRNSNNGSILITAKENLNYTVTLEGTTQFKTFSTSTQFDNLAAGTYTLYITTTADANYKQYFTVVITEPSDLAVLTKKNTINNEITLTLSGSDSYKIDLNGESYKTNQSQITLTLKEGLNDLKVKTEADCQGIYEDKILVSTSQIYFTNPVTNELKIEGDFIGKPISYSLVSLSAQRIIEKSFQATENSIVIPMTNLSEGIYFFTINYSAKTEQLKIIKQ
ncbi:hypothetical protein FUMI01_23330 [Flavobacterium sp. UMI-01]|nr:hypothetical protein FUMI01_23330 [Flavobacterium sp. UMI-01]